MMRAARRVCAPLSGARFEPQGRVRSAPSIARLPPVSAPPAACWSDGHLDAPRDAAFQQDRGRRKQPTVAFVFPCNRGVPHAGRPCPIRPAIPPGNRRPAQLVPWSPFERGVSGGVLVPTAQDGRRRQSVGRVNPALAGVGASGRPCSGTRRGVPVSTMSRLSGGSQQ